MMVKIHRNKDNTVTIQGLKPDEFSHIERAVFALWWKSCDFLPYYREDEYENSELKPPEGFWKWYNEAYAEFNKHRDIYSRLRSVFEWFAWEETHIPKSQNEQESEEK